MYIVRWYWIRACPMMCAWWCNSFFYRSEFLNKKIKRGQIDIIIKEREGGQKWRQSWQQKENDGALMTSQLLKVRGRVWTLRNGRGPCVSQTLEVIRLIWPITWNDSSCCYFAPCFCEHTPSCNPDDLGQDKTKIFGSNDLNITKMFIFWSTELRLLRCSTKQKKNYKKWRD